MLEDIMSEEFTSFCYSRKETAEMNKNYKVAFDPHMETIRNGILDIISDCGRLYYAGSVK